MCAAGPTPPDPPGAGQLVLAATPIGNPGDASARLVKLLSTADVIAAEDTRRLKKLLNFLDVTTPAGQQLISCHDHNETGRANHIAQLVAAGQHVVLVSDAGMPLVNDPGYPTVQAVIAAGGHVTCAPGPSAVLAAIAVSGLPTDRFAFDGFFGRKPGDRRKQLTAILHEPRTTVFFDSPRRLAATLADCVDVLGADRPMVVCRELTKTHEETLRGTAATLADWAAGTDVLGEIVVVIGGAEPQQLSVDEALTVIAQRVAAGERLKDVTREVARQTGVTGRELYSKACKDHPTSGEGMVPDP